MRTVHGAYAPVSEPFGNRLENFARQHCSCSATVANRYAARGRGSRPCFYGHSAEPGQLGLPAPRSKLWAAGRETPIAATAM